MQLKKINNLVRWWLTPKFPDKHLENLNLSDALVKTWMFHPFKRRIARYYVSYLKKNFNLKVIAVTGSAGKTTTKEMLASILKNKGETIYSYANIDPIFNIPSTIFKAKTGTKFMVLEMGVEYPGEMDFYMWMVRPDVSIITNIYPTHTLYFGSEKGVFEEKKKILQFLNKDNFAVLNSDDRWLRKLKNELKSQIIWFGKNSEVRSINEKLNQKYQTHFDLVSDGKLKKTMKVCLKIAGRQHVENALAAAAAAKALGIDMQTIKRGLEDFELPPHRMSVVKHNSGALIVDDSYNNNPQAAKVALTNFNRIAGSKKKIIVFGDMLELGNSDAKHHKELGEFITNIDPLLLICVGKSSIETAKYAKKKLGSNKVIHVTNWEEALTETRKYLTLGNAIFIKGSRSIGLDKLVAQIL